MTDNISDKPTRVALVEDDPDQRAALVRILRGVRTLDFMAALSTAEEAERALRALTPDVVLVDLNLPGRSGTDLVCALKPVLPATEFMMLTVVDNPAHVFEALAAGASGYLLKHSDPNRLVEAIVDLHHGGAPMSAPIARLVIKCFHKPPPVPNPEAVLAPREREVLEWLAQGWSYKEVADRMTVSLGTVRTYIKRIYTRLHVHNRVDAMRAAGLMTSIAKRR
jgi:DNA-binding NarL/FixJ family response regulator